MNQDSTSVTNRAKPRDSSQSSQSSNNPTSKQSNNHEDDLLKQLLGLEAKLEADQNRKQAHQKPQLQAMWQEEIAELKVRLGL